MIYPKKIKNKTINKFFKITILVLALVSIALLILNKLTTPDIYWSHLCIIGFIYIYCTVRYSLTKATNIAGHIMVQSVLTALFLYFIDYQIGYKGWSINICFPIIVIFANIAMFIITIVSHKHFGKFAISQLVIVLLSLSSTYFIYKGLIKASLLINVSILISIINFGFSLILCHKDYKEELVRKFNR